MEKSFVVSGKVVDVFNRQITNARLYVAGKKILKIEH